MTGEDEGGPREGSRPRKQRKVDPGGTQTSGLGHSQSLAQVRLEKLAHCMASLSDIGRGQKVNDRSWRSKSAVFSVNNDLTADSEKQDTLWGFKAQPAGERGRAGFN